MTNPKFPGIRVRDIRKIYDDGRHNAFTDLCRFRDRFYLAFRSSPDGHQVSPTSRILVLSSVDGRAWSEVFAFSVPDGDVRDPHFLVFRDQLFVYSGTWLCDPADPARHHINRHLGYGAASADGRVWDGPRALEGTYGHYIWRAAAHGDRAYLCGRRLREFVEPAHPDPSRVVKEAALLESEDGWVWRWAGMLREEKGNETALWFEPDGTLLALARDAEDSLLCRSRPPFREWTRTGLGRYVGGPLLTRWGTRYLVGGRKWLAPGEPDKQPRTVLSWLEEGRLIDRAVLPSGGDNSYPGFAPLDDRRGLLSYYSSHEGSMGKGPPSAIYVADIEVEEA